MPRGPREGDEAAPQTRRRRRTRTATSVTPARAEKRIARKVERVMEQTWGGYEGESIAQILERHLLGACVKYLEVKEKTEGEEDEEYTAIEWIEIDKDRAGKRGKARGVVRGLAEAVAIWRNPYTAKSMVKSTEKEFMRKARHAMAVVSTERPLTRL